MTRVAVYATPAQNSELSRLAAVWLGRDVFTGLPTRAPDPERDPLVAEPARYGFHATLRAPFRPKPDVGLDALADRLRSFCTGRAAPVIPRLVLERLGAFFALVPGEPLAALYTLEADVLRAFEPYRTPLDAEGIARRRPERLSERQRHLLALWGYPFVLDEFRFHMTVTGPVPGLAEDLHNEIEGHFAGVLGRPLAVDGLGLFVEFEPGAPFRVHSFHPFGPPGPLKPA